MARVLLATLRGAGGFEKKLVVKQIREELAFDQQFVRRFVEEAKTTVALSHPNIVPVYELGLEQGTYFLAMELVEGVSVAELVRERNADGSRRVLTPDEGAYIGIEVCRALDYAHRRMKVVHRDITPRNVMIDEEGQIKLIDFGIAAPSLVAGHEILGSPGHMPPEQVEGGELGPPTDIFAVAVLLMEAWTGAAPFRRATPEECSSAIHEPHPRPSDFDARLVPLDGAMSRAMNVDPRARQQEASELARELRTFLQGLDVADVARGLGDRVRDLRIAASSPPPASVHDVPRTSNASHAELGTRTFAAREEALRWSKPPTPLDDDPSPSTRRIEEGSPISGDGRRKPTRGLRDDPAMAIATPLMVDAAELEKIHEDLAAARAKRQSLHPAPLAPAPRDARANAAGAVVEKLETIATRPLEAPARVSRPSAPPMRRLAVLGGGLVMLAVASGALFLRSRSGHDDAAGGPAAGRAPPSAMAHPPEMPPSIAPTPTEGEKAASSFPSSAAAASVPQVASASPVGKATAVFLGEPGTRVVVDGSPRGACPYRTTLPEGPHEVRFTFEPTGESRGERFHLKPGERVTVRAEFTSASPSVKIQR